MTFESFNIDAQILAAIKAQAFKEPTSIQLKAIPQVLAGKDILGLAQTGSGKTAAFVIPILQRLCKQPLQKPRALIIAPTRELAVQIERVIQDLAAHIKVKSATIFGGVAFGPQVKKLRQGVDIIVACPGRLLDHIQQGTIDLKSIEVLVLDEADRMFDMGFLPVIRQIIKHIPAKRQTLLFSATMPDDIRKLASSILKDAITVDVGTKQAVTTIAHAIYPLDEHLKSKLLVELFTRIEPQSVIVFTRTKHRAKKLTETLSGCGYRTTSLQGNLSQNRRQEAMEGFRTQKYNILVATDIAARGIDISNVSHVINFDMPDTVETYTHRIGRTGRATRSGQAFTFVTAEDAPMVLSIERKLGKALQRCQIEGFDYKAQKGASNEFRRTPQKQFSSRRPAMNRNSSKSSRTGRTWSRFSADNFA